MHRSYGLQHLRHKRLTFAFTGESGYTLAFASRSSHSGSHAEIGALPPVNTAQLCATNRIALNATSAILDSAALLYTYIPRFFVNPHYQQREKIRQRCHRNSVPNRFSSRFSTSLTNGPRSLSWTKVRTPSAFGERSHTRAYTPKQGPSGQGRYHYPRSVPHVHKHPRAGCQNGVLCRFWALVGGALEEHRKPSGQRCAYARRCPEASRPRWAAQTDTAR